MKHVSDDPVTWRILEARAHDLASEGATATTAVGKELLSFRLGDARYSMSAQLVREVQPLAAWTPLPSTPPCIVGLVNVRGRLIVALDIRPLLNIAPACPQSGACLLIVGGHATEVGILADAVIGIQQSTTLRAPMFSTMIDHKIAWIQGVDRELNLQIDPNALLADPRLIDN